MFKLVRFFSIASIIAFVATAILLGYFHRQISINNLIAVREAGNVEVTQLFVNAVWDDYEEFFLTEAPNLSNEDLPTASTTADFRATVLQHMAGLQVVKIKVFGLDGRTLFSTEAAQIGEDKANNAGFLSAKNGVAASELTYRGEFSAFEGIIEDRNVIASYVPLISNTATGEIIGVFEVYEDVTPLLDRINFTQTWLIGGVVAFLSALYAGLLVIVRHAEGIMHRQQHERDQALTSLQTSEQRLRDLVNNAPVLLWTFTPDYKVQTVEGRQIERRNLDPSSYLNRPASVLHVDVYDAVVQAATGKDSQARFSLQDATFDTHFAPRYDSTNQLVSIIGVSHDVTDLIKVKEALDGTQQNLHLRNRQLERAMEFTKMTLESMENAVKRGATKSELDAYLHEANAQFHTLN